MVNRVLNFYIPVLGSDQETAESVPSLEDVSLNSAICSSVSYKADQENIVKSN